MAAGDDAEEELLQKGEIVLDADPGICEDLEKECVDWAYDGKCTESKEYMVISPPIEMHACLDFVDATLSFELPPLQTL